MGLFYKIKRLLGFKPSKLKVCVNCRYLSGNVFKYCECPKLGISNVTGQVDYQLANTVRNFYCKGNWYNEI